jgi:hypothetical protein
MKREDWQVIEKRLVYPGASAKLTVDGYAVDLQVELDKMRMIITVYVNGSWKGIWLTTDCEERRRFMRPVIRRRKPFTPQQIRLLGKKWCEEQRKPFTYYLPYWPTVGAIRRHFEKHNSSIELVVVAP